MIMIRNGRRRCCRRRCCTQQVALSRRTSSYLRSRISSSSSSSSHDFAICRREQIRQAPPLQHRIPRQPFTTTTTTTNALVVVATNRTRQWQLQQQQHHHHHHFRHSLFSTVSSSSSSSSTNEIDATTATTTTTTTKAILPTKVDIVIIGGGIIGSSVAYHCGLKAAEQQQQQQSSTSSLSSIAVLEQNTITSGTTWHAAGLINTFGSLSSTSTAMRQYTKHLYSEILPNMENITHTMMNSHNTTNTSSSTGYMDIGFIELACDVDRLYYYRKVKAYNQYCGIDVQEITPQHVQELFPACRVDDVLAGFYVPTDGRTNPVDTTMALVKAAHCVHPHQVQFLEHTGVKRVLTRRNPNRSLVSYVTGVELLNGTTIDCNVVVNCTGMWSRQLGEQNDIDCIPNQAAEHYYCITEPIDPAIIHPHCPVIEDSSKYTYIRPESGGVMIGLFEPTGAVWNSQSIPNDFAYGQIEPNWDRMGPYLEEAMKRVPCIQDVGIKSFFCGPESFTPDNHPVVGPIPTIQNYFVAAGMNSIGILTGGGIGKIIADWIYNTNRVAPSNVDVTSIHVNRFHKYQQNIEYRQARVEEALGETYKVHYPDHQLKTCRNIKKSAIHYQIQQHTKPCFRNVSGWESPAWYAPLQSPPGCAAIEPLSNINIVQNKESFGREYWFNHWANEHVACRTNVALFEMTFMSKLLVQGCDAGSFLNYLSTANVLHPKGIVSVGSNDSHVTYTQWLNENGYIEADVTVAKINDDEYLVIATDTMHRHVYTHMMQRLNRTIHAFVTDVTTKYIQLNIQGPKSREFMQSLTTNDMSNRAFPYRHVADIDFGLARVLCIRITYVGELGYELYIPVEYADYVYNRVIEHGTSSLSPIQHAGLRALGSLRMEKGYRDYGHDIDNTDTVFEAGLGFTCDFTKDGGFIGMDHVLEQKKTIHQTLGGGLPKRMVNVVLNDPEPLLHHSEIVWRNNIRVGDIRSASYGHSIGGAVGLSMIDTTSSSTTATTTNKHSEIITKDYIANGTWEVEIANQRYPCRVSLTPFYDPKGDRMKQ